VATCGCTVSCGPRLLRSLGCDTLLPAGTKTNICMNVAHPARHGPRWSAMARSGLGYGCRRPLKR